MTMPARRRNPAGGHPPPDAAIASGGEFASLVAALQLHERQEMEAQLTALRAPQVTSDAAAVNKQLRRVPERSRQTNL